MTEVFAGAWLMLATAWRSSRWKTVTAALLMVMGSASAPLLAATLAWMTTEVITHHGTQAAVAGACIALLVLGFTIFDHFSSMIYLELAEIAEVTYDDELIKLSNGSAGIAHHEQPRSVDMLTVLKREGRQFSRRLEAVLRGLGLLVAMILSAVLLVRVAPVLILLPLAAVPPLLCGKWAERISDRAKMAVAEESRTALNLFSLCTTAGPASELRVFRLGGELRRRHDALWASVVHTQVRAELAATWLRAAGQVFFVVAYVAAVLLVVRDAVLGRRGVGDVVLVLTLAAQTSQQVAQVMTLFTSLQQTASMYRRLAGFRAAVAEVEPADTNHAPADRLRQGIELSGVSFSYPGTDVPVLRDIALRLPAGSTVALVGDNGAGKSTLVKLLCALYQPTGGQIRVDGVDLRRMPPHRWRERVATGFQDFVRYEFRARHAIGIGDLSHIGSPGAVIAAMKRARGDDLLTRLADGLETQLGKSYNDGTELSGGEWQKITLGRAFMREAPLLLVLDEPTSALDAEAEAALFDRYARQVKQVASQTGGVTVLVSHRFSTVRMADLIVVLDGGRIVEYGDHATLTKRGGMYAELFDIHSRAYA